MAAAARASLSVTLSSVIRGHHVYKTIWMPSIGENLEVQVDEGNEHDSFAVAVIKVGQVVGHAPREHSKIFWYFIRRGGSIMCTVTGRRKKGVGLEVPCNYQFAGSEKLLRQL